MLTLKPTSIDMVYDTTSATSKKQNKGIGTISARNRQTNTGFQSKSSMSTGMQNTSVSQLPNEIDTDPLLQDILFSNDVTSREIIQRLYRDIYYNDAVGGSAVDLYSTLPFSEFGIGGITDDKIMEPYMETVERLNIRTLLSELSVDHLVSGAFLGSLLFDRNREIFLDIMTHRIEDAEIQALPFYGQDPIINVSIPEELRTILSSTSDSKRVKQVQAMLGPDVIKTLTSAEIELDAISTIYIPRKTFSNNPLGTSYYRRILPIYLIEKNLFRGTLVESSRRQRGMLHISLGDGEDWIPTIEDMNATTDLFMNADADPLGAVITTRTGIATEELRAGGEFWKITDIWDSTVQNKLRALGISEAFLSGEVNYNCVSGDTLITTSKGIIRIDEIAKKENGKIQDINLQSASRYGKEVAAKWLFQGKAPTVTISMHKASSLCGTPKHKILVLNKQRTQWKQLSDIRIGDYVAISLDKLVRTSKLKLDLKTIPMIGKGIGRGQLHSVDYELKKPKYMTPELAFIMAFIIAEGTIQGTNIKVGNTNIDLINKYIDCFEKVFNFKPTVSLAYTKGSVTEINGTTYTRNKDFYLAITSRRGLVDWLSELGCSHKTGRIEGKTPSYFKEIPWAVLQADEESQLAFLAGYLETDGYASKGGMTIEYSSYSSKLRNQMYVMLSSMGIMTSLNKTKVSIYGSNAAKLYAKLKPYLVSKQHDTFNKTGVCHYYGVPADSFLTTVRNAIVKSNNSGTVVRLQDGTELKVRKGTLKLKTKAFLYDLFEAGVYDEFLQVLKRIDAETYTNLMELFTLKYNFTPVETIKNSGVKEVYDLSMQKGAEPSYNVNCIVGHNTSDTSLTVFVESLRAYRDMITRKLFYNKIFPLVSLVKGYTVNAKGKVVKRSGLLDGDSEEVLRRMQDGSKLLIPTVHWAKQLKPEGDTAYLDILNTMTEKGVPVPLRAFAAAGGFNLEQLLQQQDDDFKLQKRLFAYQKELQKLKSDFGPKAAEGESLSSVMSDNSIRRLLDNNKDLANKSAVMKGNGRPALFDRDFGDSGEVIGTTRTGKKRYLHNQAQQQAKANEAIVKALKNIKKHQNTPLTNTTTTPFKPSTQEASVLKRRL